MLEIVKQSDDITGKTSAFGTSLQRITTGVKD